MLHHIPSLHSSPFLPLSAASSLVRRRLLLSLLPLTTVKPINQLENDDNSRSERHLHGRVVELVVGRVEGFDTREGGGEGAVEGEREGEGVGEAFC